MSLSVLRVLVPVVIGAALGGVVGWVGRCSTGTCPLLSSWWRGALYGALVGLVAGAGSRAG